jgi:alkaline phosphatase
MAYVDGFVIPVPKKSLKAYVQISKKAGKLWKKHGALEYRECVGDDMNIKGILPFPKLTGSKAGETVIFSWIVYKSKAHRDRVNKKVMSDPAMGQPECPFDPARMAYGGFKVIVDL